jgi:hypothetical protein
MCRICSPCGARVGAYTARAAPSALPLTGRGLGSYTSWLPRPAHPSFGPRGLLLRAFGGGPLCFPPTLKNGPKYVAYVAHCGARVAGHGQGGSYLFSPPCTIGGSGYLASLRPAYSSSGARMACNECGGYREELVLNPRRDFMLTLDPPPMSGVFYFFAGGFCLLQTPEDGFQGGPPPPGRRHPACSELDGA